MVDRHAATLYDILNSSEAESDQIVALIRISKDAKCNIVWPWLLTGRGADRTGDFILWLWSEPWS